MLFRRLIFALPVAACLMLPPVPLTAQTEFRVAPAFTVAPQVFRQALDSNVLFSVANANPQSLQWLSTGDSFVFTVDAASAAVVSVRPGVNTIGEELVAADFAAAAGPGPNQVTITYTGAAGARFRPGAGFSAEAIINLPLVGSGQVSVSGPQDAARFIPQLQSPSAITAVNFLIAPMDPKGGTTGAGASPLTQPEKGDKGDKGDPGPAGPAGAKGDKGDTGDTGSKGDTGTTGSKGDKGLDGANGAKGDKGDKGDTGSNGADGSKGDKGDKGTDGANGAKGDKGDTGSNGANGSKGDKGDNGPKGDKGDNGAKGDNGPKGDNGANGTNGANGAKGDNGLNGAKGDNGPKGDSGANGTNGAKGDNGPKGDNGTNGAKGDKGDNGPQGEKGDNGAQGSAGPQGNIGPAGPKGDQGEKGDAGKQGAAGPKGDKGDAGAMGPVGPFGPQGNEGPQGTPGPLSIVSVVAGNFLVSDLTTGFAGITGGNPRPLSTQAATPSPMDCTYGSLNVLAIGPSLSATKVDVTLFVDGVASALTCRANFSDATRCTDLSDGVRVRTGQATSMRVRFDPAPPEGGQVSWALICK